MAIGMILRNARIAKQLTESQVAEMTRMKIQIVQDLEKDDFHRIAATIYGKGFIKLYAECVGLDPQPLINDYMRTATGGNSPSLITKGVQSDAHEKHKTPVKRKIKAHKRDNPPTAPIRQEESEQTLAGDDIDTAEEDLFSYTRKKNTIVDDEIRREEEPASHTVSSEPSFWISLSHKVAIFITKSKECTIEQFNRLADIQWGDTPIKIIGSTVVALFVLLIIVIGVKSCSHNSTNDGDTTHSILQTPASPPEPYFD